MQGARGCVRACVCMRRPSVCHMSIRVILGNVAMCQRVGDIGEPRPKARAADGRHDGHADARILGTPRESEPPSRCRHGARVPETRGRAENALEVGSPLDITAVGEVGVEILDALIGLQVTDGHGVNVIPDVKIRLTVSSTSWLRRPLRLVAERESCARRESDDHAEFTRRDSSGERVTSVPVAYLPRGRPDPSNLRSAAANATIGLFAATNPVAGLGDVFRLLKVCPEGDPSEQNH